MFPSFLMDPKFAAAMERQRKHHAEQRMPLCVPWDPNIKWQKELNIKAETFPVRSLFEVKTTNCNSPNASKKDELVLSPSKQYCYCEKRLPRGEMLQTVYGDKTGDVLFDGPVIIPALHEKDMFRTSEWNTEPWMSTTPMEIITLRGGTRLAKGTTIVAGLGLGHQLIEVSKRKQVKKLILVEKSQELIDWLYPRIEPHLGQKVKVVVGDAYKELPKMKADVCLLDIFARYGFNNRERDKLREQCKNIGFIWAWGASELRS